LHCGAEQPARLLAEISVMVLARAVRDVMLLELFAYQRDMTFWVMMGFVD
jgi:hypothetical protein